MQNTGEAEGGERGHCFLAPRLPVVMLPRFLNYISTKSEVKEATLWGWGRVIYCSYWAFSKSSQMYLFLVLILLYFLYNFKYIKVYFYFYLLLSLHIIYIALTCHIIFIIYVIKMVFGIQTWNHGMNFKKSQKPRLLKPLLSSGETLTDCSGSCDVCS